MRCETKRRVELRLLCPPRQFSWRRRRDRVLRDGCRFDHGTRAAASPFLSRNKNVPSNSMQRRCGKARFFINASWLETWAVVELHTRVCRSSHTLDWVFFLSLRNLLFLLENDTLIMWKLHAANSAGSFCGNGLLCTASSLLVSRPWAKNTQLGSKAADVSRPCATVKLQSLCGACDLDWGPESGLYK